MLNSKQIWKEFNKFQTQKMHEVEKLRICSPPPIRPFEKKMKLKQYMEIHKQIKYILIFWILL
jgi:hypothetical protein